MQCWGGLLSADSSLGNLWLLMNLEQKTCPVNLDRLQLESKKKSSLEAKLKSTREPTRQLLAGCIRSRVSSFLCRGSILSLFLRTGLVLNQVRNALLSLFLFFYVDLLFCVKNVHLPINIIVFVPSESKEIQKQSNRLI